MTHFFNFISREVDTAEPAEVFFKEEAETLTFRETERITRVAPKRSRKNSAGEEIFDVEEEEAPTAASRTIFLIQKTNSNCSTLSMKQ
jgi:hypothetical protein